MGKRQAGLADGGVWGSHIPFSRVRPAGLTHGKPPLAICPPSAFLIPAKATPQSPAGWTLAKHNTETPKNPLSYNFYISFLWERYKKESQCLGTEFLGGILTTPFSAPCRGLLGDFGFAGLQTGSALHLRFFKMPLDSQALSGYCSGPYEANTTNQLQLLP